MMSEQARSRSGEPVLVKVDDGRWLPGYIEFGDETTNCISIATEPSGYRIIVDRRDIAKRIRPDPEGLRPLRDSRGITWTPR